MHGRTNLAFDERINAGDFRFNPIYGPNPASTETKRENIFLTLGGFGSGDAEQNAL